MSLTNMISIQLLVIVLVATHFASAQLSSRVAIVGAGIGGAFTAEQIMERSEAEFQPDIDIFEASETTGGRVTEYSYAGEALEVGASIFWDRNVYVREAAERLGLTVKTRKSGGKRSSDVGGGGGGGKDGLQAKAAAGAFGGMAIWNGTAFVVNMTGSWQDTLRTARRYGTAALRYRWLVADAMRRFDRLYGLQRAGVTWASPEQMLRELGLYNETQQSAADFMTAWLRQRAWWLWGSEQFIEELVGAVNRCNYNQHNEQLNALTGLVSYAPAAYGKILQVEGGNRQVVSGLLAASGARLLTSSRVTAVRRRAGDGRYMLEVAAAGGAVGESQGDDAAAKPQVFGPYDAVVLATPLVGSGIHLDLGVQHQPDDGTTETADKAAADGREGGGAAATATCGAEGAAATAAAAAATPLEELFQVTVTSFVAAGLLRPGFFGVEQMPPVGLVFVTNGAKAPFSAVRALRPAEAADGGAGTRVYKIFSTEELSQQLLDQLFEPSPQPPKLLHSRRWYAYPRYRPPEHFTPFLVAPGLVHSNAIEAAASAMEMSAIAGVNSALLVLQHLREQRRLEGGAEEGLQGQERRDGVLGQQQQEEGFQDLQQGTVEVVQVEEDTVGGVQHELAREVEGRMEQGVEQSVEQRVKAEAEEVAAAA